MNEEVSYYANCSGAKKRKKKIKKKEKVDVFLMHEKVIEFISSTISQIKIELSNKISKLANYKIPYGIDENKVINILKEHKLSPNPTKNITYYDMKKELEAIDDMNKKVEELPFKLFVFQKDSEKILNKTREIINTPVKINFFTKKESSSKNDKDLENLKDSMVELCRPYIDFSEEKEAREECNNCGNTKLIETENEIICDNCGISKMKTLNFSSYNDNERVSYSQKYKYKKINHFKDTIRQFQGIQNKHIEKKVIEDLKTSLEKDKIIDHSLTNPYSKLTKEHLRIYMDHTGHNKYYEDINLIYHHFTGKECPTINQNIYNKLLDDFEKLVQMFISISENEDKIERTNFLNSQYVLYQLLKRHNYPCTENDFALPRSVKCRVDQEKIFIMLCEKLHWSYVSIL